MKIPRSYRYMIDSPGGGREWRFFNHRGTHPVLRAIIGATAVLGLIIVLLWSEHQPVQNQVAQSARKRSTSMVFKRFLDYNEDTNIKSRIKMKDEQKFLKKLHKDADHHTYLFMKNGSKYTLVRENLEGKENHMETVKLIEDESSGHVTPNISSTNPNSTVIYVITPTYKRPEQVAELTRLSQTMMLVKNVHWLVAEDAQLPTKRVVDFLNDCPVKNTYLLAKKLYKKKGKEKARGVSNRNTALKWIQHHAKSGVFYFADDDNTYDYKIFEEIRGTKRISMFPVGLVTKLGVSSPIVKDGVIIGFYDGWIAGRRFPVDMAGFAVNVEFYLMRKSPLMPYTVGFEEDGFLRALSASPKDVQPLANNCTKIMVWHTKTVGNIAAQTMPDNPQVKLSNLEWLKGQIVFQDKPKFLGLT